MVLNTLLVTTLTLFNLYIPIVMYIIFAVETFLLMYLFRSVLLSSVAQWFTTLLHSLYRMFSQLTEWIRALSEQNPWFSTGYLLFSAITLYFSIDSILWLFKVAIDNVGDIFNLGDAVVSWNPWAIYWFNNRIPPANYYPQLIPTNWSVTYVFIRTTDVQMFAASIMPFFASFSLLIFYLLAWRGKNIGFLVGLVAARFMMKKFIGGVLADGYVEPVILFFGLLSVSSLLLARWAEDDRQSSRYATWGLISAIACALTKQAGLYIVAVYPVLYYFMLDTDSITDLGKGSWRRAFRHWIIAMALILANYAIAQIMIWAGLNVSNIAHVTQEVHAGRTYFQRFGRSVRILEKYNILYIMSILGLPLIKEEYKRLLFGIVLPYSLIWAFFFSYDARNLALAIPIVALTAGIAVNDILLWFIRRITGVHRIRVPFYLMLMLLIIGMIGLNFFWQEDELIAHQYQLQRQLFFPALNDAIYSLLEEEDQSVRILSSYRIDLLPGLEDHALLDHLDDYDQFKQKLTEGDVGYILFGVATSSDISDFIWDQVNDGTYDMRFEFGTWKMVEILEE